jgi:hypothetical protein
MIDQDDIPESLRDLIAAEKSRPNPTPEVGQRVYARLAAGLGLPPMLGDSAPVAPIPAAPAAPAATAVAGAVAKTAAHGTARGLLTFIVGAAVGATTYGTVQHLRHGAEPTAAPTATAPAPAPAIPPPPAPPPAEAQPETAKPAAPPPGRAGVAEPPLAASRDRGLAAERKLVEMARSALARGHIDGALASLRRHARGFPKGQLAEERDSLFVQALVAKGDFVRARSHAEYFHRHYPHSLFSPVVDQALRSIP